MNAVLLCATDAGGARNLSLLVSAVRAKGMRPFVVASNDTRYFFELHGAATDDFVTKPIASKDDAISLLKEMSPCAVIGGTTRFIQAERYMTVASRQLGIRCITVLDEWFNYRKRFEDESGRLIYLPDAIAVMDEYARDEAITEGIPVSLCHVTGSVPLSLLGQKANEYELHPPLVPVCWLPGTGHERTIKVVFIAENFAHDLGRNPGECGPMGPYLGFTEETVKEDIIAVLKSIPEKITLIEKIHPSIATPIPAERHEGNVHVISVKEVDLHALVWHSDLVIGMRSIALLEAALLRKHVVSYQPGLLVKNECVAVKRGIVEGIYSREALYKWVRSYNIRRVAEISCSDLSFINRNAVENVLELAMQTKREDI